MSGGVPAGELRDFASLMVDEVIAKVRVQLDAGESLSVADQRLMLEQLIVERKRLHSTPTPPTEGRDADVERAREDGRIAGLEEAALIAQTYGVPGGYVADAARGVAKAILARAALQALGERG